MTYQCAPVKRTLTSHHSANTRCSRVDPFSRLRVPRYQKIFEVLFFVVFLALYYSVLIERNYTGITPREILLLIWIAAFAVDEVGQYVDAGLRLYAVDFWSLWDIGIIGIGLAFLVSRKSRHSEYDPPDSCS